MEVWWLRQQLPLQGSNPSGELRTLMPGVAKKIERKKKKKVKQARKMILKTTAGMEKG